jgi:hypothetical protein
MSIIRHRGVQNTYATVYLRKNGKLKKEESLLERQTQEKFLFFCFKD